MIEVRDVAAFRLSIAGHELQMDPQMFNYIRVHSSLQVFLPMIEMQINDRGGIISEYMSLAGGEQVEIQYGVTPDEFNTRPFRFRVDSYDAPATSMNDEQGTILTLRGTMDVAPLLFRPLHNRAFPDARSSEVVEAIADEMGLNARVERTDDQMTWLQPHWTNAQLIRYTSARAVSEDGHGAYVYGIDKDGRFLYRSMVSLYRQAIRRRWKMVSDPEALTDPELAREALHGYEVTNRKELTGLTGGYGVTVHSFNWATKQTAADGYVPTQLKNRSLSDRLNILTGDENANVRQLDLGRLQSDANHGNWSLARGYDHVVRRVGGAFKLHTIVRGDSSLRIGDKIALRIRSSDPDQGIHTPYSGTWIIERIVDAISVTGYWSKLVLSREGVNAGERGARELISVGGGNTG